MVELVSAACNMSKTEFIRESILERLSKNNNSNYVKKMVLDFSYRGIWFYKFLRGFSKAAYTSDGFWLLAQFVGGVAAVIFISKLVNR
jgi:hypothetical protein